MAGLARAKAHGTWIVLDRSLNTLTAHLSGLNNDGQGCFRVQSSITATKS